MTTSDSVHLGGMRRTILLSSVALLAMAVSTADACPLGGHDSPRVRLLHALEQKEHGGPAHGMVMAQVQLQKQAARTELGPYGRDLPHGAAAPTADTKPALRDNLGKLSWSTVEPSSAEARAYFEQGYRLGWGFNHAEAARAFRAAQEADPSCTMCLWGEAWVLGPHINYPLEADANARAIAVLEKAKQLPKAGELQAALIEALSQRYSADPTADRRSLDQAYADGMEAVQARFPHDPHVALLTADALMNLSPWDYWADGGKTPKGKTERMVALIEGVLGTRELGLLAAYPDHPGAIHLYIHAVEASDHPERAAPHAARLAELMPGAGHVVHMPSHIWYRLGRWRESLDANVQAAAADETLMKQGGASLLYSEGYYAHNVHFVMVSALMGGDGRVSVDAADKLAGIVSERAKREVPWTQPIAAAPYYAHARFTPPDAVLALPEPEGAFPFIKASWHYARGIALTRVGRTEEARREAAAIDELARTKEITALPDLGVPGPDILMISSSEIEARLAEAAGDHTRAVELYTKAADVQDRLPYMEPPFWYYPVHQSLGAVLMAQGKPDEAEAAFRAALKRSPNNGWAAVGLMKAAEAKGDAQATEEARILLQKNWFGETTPPLDLL